MMDYIPARLVKGRHWYIVFYAMDPLTGRRERFRQSFDLNRIKSPRERIAKARQVVEVINRRLPYGYPYSEKSETEKRATTQPGERLMRHNAGYSKSTAAGRPWVITQTDIH